MLIFVGNLSVLATEKELRTLFAAHGEVASVKIMTDNRTRRSRGFGFVEMPDVRQGETAIASLHNTSVLNQEIIVNEASAHARAAAGYV